jgi:probable HAF family extracellular repeat protein
MRIVKARLALLILVLAASSGGGRAASVVATGATAAAIVALAPLPGDDHSGLASLSDGGQVTGWSGPYHTGTQSRAAYYGDAGQAPVPLPGSGSVNARGEVAGAVTLGAAHEGRMRAFLWSDGATADLPSLPGDPYSRADGINNRSEVVGASYRPAPPGEAGGGRFVERPVLWRDRVPIDLGAPVGSTLIGRAFLSDAGAAVFALALPGESSARGFLWRDGALVDLSAPPGYTSFAPEAINATGAVVGEARRPPTPDGGNRAFLWRDGQFTEIGTLPGAGASTAQGVGARGHIIGHAVGGPALVGAFLWHDSALTPLGLPGARDSLATAVNAAGQVVGYASDQGAHRAFLHNGGATIDLNSLLPADSGWILEEALAVNDAGQIAGVGRVGGVRRGFVLTLPTSCGQVSPETGYCIEARFSERWAAGGLAVNGYPIEGARLERLEDGRRYLVQYFERVRLEWHPENAPPHDILLGQFGRRILAGVPGVPSAPAPPRDGYAHFPETGHNVRPRFLAYWEAHGGLAQFGYPLSEEFVEVLGDGNSYTVQYFERARFEHHPENAPPYDVLLGQFGRRILGER